MFEHVALRASDSGRSARALAAALAELGIEQTVSADGLAIWSRLAVAAAAAEHQATSLAHVALIAQGVAEVEAFWRAGIAAGLTDDGAPGPRTQYGDDYHAAFLRDADGNSIEAVHHSEAPRTGLIDHVAIRVAELTRSSAFYELVASAAGLTARREAGSTAIVTGSPGDSLLVLPGVPTRNLHLAYAAPDEAAVQRFHREATAAGHRDNGGPGPRPQYGDDYYSAFVLDPDGNNIELVARTSP